MSRITSTTMNRLMQLRAPLPTEICPPRYTQSEVAAMTTPVLMVRSQCNYPNFLYVRDMMIAELRRRGALSPLEVWTIGPPSA